MPHSIGQKQKDLLRDFAETEDRTVLPESRGFFDKLMDYLGGNGES